MKRKTSAPAKPSSEALIGQFEDRLRDIAAGTCGDVDASYVDLSHLSRQSFARFVRVVEQTWNPMGADDRGIPRSVPAEIWGEWHDVKEAAIWLFKLNCNPRPAR